MDSINSLARLAEVVRKRIASEEIGKRKGQALTTARSASPASVDVLRVQIDRACGAIDDRDPLRTTKRMRIFVESVLAWQFGAALMSDPRFSELVDGVQSALEKDQVCVDTFQHAFQGSHGTPSPPAEEGQ